nr:SAM-dependent methyltransferase [bacterium]
MTELYDNLRALAAHDVKKMVISKPATPSAPYVKIVIERRADYYQAAQYTHTQVYHINMSPDHLAAYLLETVPGQYLQINAWDPAQEHMLLISKKGKVTCKQRKLAAPIAPVSGQHNRQKRYLLEEGAPIAPLVDMGIFTPEGKIIRAMYDKFKQINRFLEMVDDCLRGYTGNSLRIIDFGCGKSYLTFVLYHYFTAIKHMDVEMIGLDLKEEVIARCNAAAQAYGYEHLHFELGDINGYRAPFDVDMVVTLHACDTATDHALYNAICWGARFILSVPCCQHEVNAAIHTQSLGLMTRYGIIQERFSALATDALRANLLACCGYKTQLLEFINMAHTPKNLLIRAVKKPAAPIKTPHPQLEEALSFMREFHVQPTLYRLLAQSGRLGDAPLSWDGTPDASTGG